MKPKLHCGLGLPLVLIKKVCFSLENFGFSHFISSKSSIFCVSDLIYEKYNVNLDTCQAEYDAYKKKHRRQYPSSFGENFDTTQKIQMLLYLVSWKFFSES